MGPNPKDGMIAIYGFQSTHPARGGTYDVLAQMMEDAKNFNPPTPRGVGPKRRAYYQANREFQSTHPARGGTILGGDPQRHGLNFNPPTPRGVGRCNITDLPVYAHFNPPTPRGVGPTHLRWLWCAGSFQSTHPARGGTSH